jgi:hypothetical protein
MVALGVDRAHLNAIVGVCARTDHMEVMTRNGQTENVGSGRTEKVKGDTKTLGRGKHFNLGAKAGIAKGRCAHSDRFEVITSADVGYPRALAGLCDNFIPTFKRVAEKTH